MELLGFTLIGCPSILNGMTIHVINLPEIGKNNNEDLNDGKLREIPENKGKKGISKTTPEGA